MNYLITKANKVFLFFVCAFIFSAINISAAFANTESTTKIQIPKTISEVWQAIDEHEASIEKLIKDNQLADIHLHAFAIRDLVQALPGLSSDLTPEKLAAVKRDSSYIGQLAVRLDKTGDANDKEGTLANFNKLQKILEQIRANYTVTPAKIN
ncbi:TPA: transporter [Legionella pneumophila]|nr:transporter [Legionella pneumophila]HAT8583781.1 transporter [Legionella pneumophila]